MTEPVDERAPDRPTPGSREPARQASDQQAAGQNAQGRDAQGRDAQGRDARGEGAGGEGAAARQALDEDTPGEPPSPQPRLFDDVKEPGAFHTIGEVAEALSIRTHVLRYWEDQFEMLRPIKRSGGRRYYRPEDIALLRRIDDLLNRQGYTIRGARLALRAAASARSPEPAPAVPAGPADAPPARPLAEEAPGAPVVERLRAIRDRLGAALDAA